MFQFGAELSDQFAGARNVETSRSLNPSLQTFSGWLAENAPRIPME